MRQETTGKSAEPPAKPPETHSRHEAKNMTTARPGGKRRWFELLDHDIAFAVKTADEIDQPPASVQRALLEDDPIGLDGAQDGMCTRGSRRIDSDDLDVVRSTFYEQPIGARHETNQRHLMAELLEHPRKIDGMRLEPAPHGRLVEDRDPHLLPAACRRRRCQNSLTAPPVRAI
jgi:hypothetical protein